MGPEPMMRMLERSVRLGMGPSTKPGQKLAQG
jgi:hypothetical protein